MVQTASRAACWQSAAPAGRWHRHDIPGLASALPLIGAVNRGAEEQRESSLLTLLGATGKQNFTCLASFLRDLETAQMPGRNSPPGSRRKAEERPEFLKGPLLASLQNSGAYEFVSIQLRGLDFPGVNKNYPQCSTGKIGNDHVFSCILYSGRFPSVNNDALLAGIDFHPSICPSSTTLHPGHVASSSQGFHIGQATSTCV